MRFWSFLESHYRHPDGTPTSEQKINPQGMCHLTEKPIELATRAMEYGSRPGENVLDLFGGSGWSLMGAEQTGRRAFLMELDPKPAGARRVNARMGVEWPPPRRKESGFVTKLLLHPAGWAGTILRRTARRVRTTARSARCSWPPSQGRVRGPDTEAAGPSGRRPENGRGLPPCLRRGARRLASDAIQGGSGRRVRAAAAVPDVSAARIRSRARHGTIAARGDIGWAAAVVDSAAELLRTAVHLFLRWPDDGDDLLSGDETR